MDKDEEVFLDAEEDVTPRRSGRKRRSTAGSTTPAAVKKPKTKMTTRHSPKGDHAGTAGPAQGPSGKQTNPRVGVGMDQDAFWTKMGGMLGGLEMRLKQETDQGAARGSGGHAG